MNTVAAGVDMSQQHVDAVTLAGWGFKVGPLNGKIPLTEHGHKDFTNSIGQVDLWWARWPQANIGARVFAGHAVIDIDPRNGGDVTWRKLTAGRELPTTLITRTGSGGRHLWFKLPYQREVRGTAGEGIDIKTDRGYLVMPGSYHPGTGGLYVCEQWASPAVLPAWLEKYVYKPVLKPVEYTPKSGKKSGNGLVKKVASAPQGERRNVFFWAACRNYEEDLNIEEDLREAARAIALPESEIEKTLLGAQGHIKGVAA